MFLCENEHRPIVFDDKEIDIKGKYLNCPLCDAIKRIETLEDELIKLKKAKSKYKV